MVGPEKRLMRKSFVTDAAIGNDFVTRLCQAQVFCNGRRLYLLGHMAAMEDSLCYCIGRRIECSPFIFQCKIYNFL